MVLLDAVNIHFSRWLIIKLFWSRTRQDKVRQKYQTRTQQKSDRLERDTMSHPRNRMLEDL